MNKFNFINSDAAHMPFLLRDEAGKLVLLFCRAESPGAWRLWFAHEEGHCQRIETGLGEETCECSPSAWQDESGWHLSFVAGGTRTFPTTRLYRMDGPSVDRLCRPMAVQATRAGYVRRDRLVYAEMCDIVHVRDRSRAFDIELPGATIRRVSYRSDRPSVILITGQWEDREPFMLEYDPDSRQHLVECDGQCAYKCAILDDHVLYVDKGEGGKHRILAAETTIRLPAHVAVRYMIDRETSKPSVEPRGGCGCGGSVTDDAPVTRPSCMECVEKHIGAVYVLLTEVRDGYAHRLRAVGHLHEAEDESQEWVELHAAIRRARKAYQTQGVIPAWDVLATHMERHGAGPRETIQARGRKHPAQLS